VRACDEVRCESAACNGILRKVPVVPSIDEDPASIRVILVSEAPPADPGDGYDGGPGALFEQTTVQAFREAGVAATSLGDIRALGVHLTTAVKCAKSGPAIEPATIRACSDLLERELALYPNASVLLLMGDVAIRAVTEIARRHAEPRPVPAGATYRVRGGEFRFRGFRVFPSYLQAGPAYGIEAAKRRMIAEDIAAALACADVPAGAAGSTA
jgi:uracil-DNA glycosylase